MPDLGNAAQTRMIVEQAGEAAARLAIHNFIAEHPELVAKPKPEIPPPLKWAAVIISSLLTMGIGGTAVWAMTTINEMQVTVARIDERMESDTKAQDGRFDEINRRLSRLEQIAGGDR